VTRVLYLIEDCPEEQELLGGLLRSIGTLQVEIFGDGLQAFDRIQQSPPQLLVLDLMVPGLDGFLMTRLLRFDQRFSQLPILCLSRLAEEGLEERVLGLGATAFLSKPIHNDRFVELVQRLLLGAT